MYNKIKNIVKTFIPKRFLFKHELKFRLLLYQFYRGNNFQCNICNKTLRKFIHNDEDKICPNCGSLDRIRRLWNIIKTEFLRDNISILDFSPSRSLYRMMKNNSSIGYISTDLSGDFLSDFTYDITNIDSRDETYDLIICYHILEHVENDVQAMKELYRVLKKGGVCIVQTPFKQGEIYEDYSITSDEGRLKHFGQKDHLRVYSAAGLEQRLSYSGFQVDMREYNTETKNMFGYKKSECILICTK